MDLKAKVVAYKGYLVIECLAEKSAKDVCTLSIDNPSCIGQVIHNTSKHLGISKEAIKLLEQVPKGNDSLGDIDFFKSNDGFWNFAWIGGPKKLANPIDCESSRDYSVPQKSQYIEIKNDVPKEVVTLLDNKKE